MGIIISIDDLVSKLQSHKSENKKIVLCHGVFDLLHIGHIRYLSKAKEFGDILVVTLTPDRYVDKGNTRPAFTEKLRAEALASLVCTDYVAINHWSTAMETLELLRPDFYAKGSEFRDVEQDPTGKIQKEAALAKELGIKLVFIEEIVFSSSHLINNYLSTLSAELEEYLRLFRSRYSLSSILEELERLRELKVLVVGDLILDEYVYCKPLGISSKDPTLALHHHAEELFNGGALAVASHVAGFVGKTTLFTFVGQDGYIDFIRNNCPQNIELLLVEHPGPTTRKRRYLDQHSFNKLFEIYHMSEEPFHPDRMLERLRDLVQSYDLVLVPDFGHGAITPAMVNILCSHSPFLAINTQANAGNRGFHTINKYPRADFVSLAEHELRLAFSNKRGDLGSMMLNLARRMGTSLLAVTCGHLGTNLFGPQGFTKTPAMPAKVVDRVGAGDALLAVTCLLARQGCPQEIIGLIGNICGAVAVSQVGNSSSLCSEVVTKHCTALLK